MTMQEYILFSDLSDEQYTEEKLNSLVTTINKTSAINLLVNINNFLALFPPSKNYGRKFEFIQKTLIANFLDDETFAEYNKKYANKGISVVDRPVFHRQQILCLIKKILLYSKNVNGIVIDDDKEAYYLIGKACLMINEYLNNESDKGFQENIGTAIEIEHNAVLNNHLAQMLATAELYNPPNIDRAVARNLEFLRISDHLQPNFYNGQTLSATIESLAGISLQRYLQLVFGIYVWYVNQEIRDLIDNPANFNLKKSVWFSTLSITDKELKSFYENNALSLEDLKIEVENDDKNKNLKFEINFNAFRKFPILYLTDNIFTCIDISFLIEKAGAGFYHTILNTLRKHLPGNMKLRESFMEHWGNVFENYINESLKEVYPNPFSIFHPDTEFDSKEKHLAFDGIVEYSHQILAMEYKSRSMKIDAKYSGNPKILLNEMDKHFGRQGKGISQIVNNLEFLFKTNYKKRKKIKDLDSSEIKVVYPILIFNDLSLEFGLANWKLTEWFIEEKNKKQLSSEITVEPLLVLTVKNLEDLIPYLLNGDFTLLDFLQFYRNYRNINKNWQYVDLTKTEEYHPMIGIREIISIFLKSKNVESRTNEKLEKIWDDFCQELTNLYIYN